MQCSGITQGKADLGPRHLIWRVCEWHDCKSDTRYHPHKECMKLSDVVESTIFKLIHAVSEVWSELCVKLDALLITGKWNRPGTIQPKVKLLWPNELVWVNYIGIELNFFQNSNIWFRTRLLVQHLLGNGCVFMTSLSLVYLEEENRSKVWIISIIK